MNFNDFAQKVIGAAEAIGENMQRRAELIESYKNRYSQLSDEELIRKYKSCTREAKMACRLLLEERGYGN